MDKDTIQVSVICNTYNHAAYIRDALEGFVNQKTNFRYEVLIHDDASTDGTADIIREYEVKYPDLIKPIYQTENQYTKGVKISWTFQFHRVTGKYVAFCEGDGYWTDLNKLQKQYDVMESHPEIDICAHRMGRVSGRTGERIGFQGPGDQTKLFNQKQVIRGEGGFVATSSLFCRSELLKEQPEFRKILSLDYTMQIYGSLRGGMMYLGESMGECRVCTPGSWTERTRKVYKTKKAFNVKLKKMLIQLNKETKHKYWDAICYVYIKTLMRDAYCVYLKLKGGNK